MNCFDVLIDAGDADALPSGLEDIYGTGLSIPAPWLYANFVQSLDGIVALRSGPSSGSIISGKSEADRFVMGLLRAKADAVLIGAGTLRTSPGHAWTAEQVFPPKAEEFAALRRSDGRTLRPRLAVVTASGEIDGTHVGLRDGAVILTTEAGAQRLTGLAENQHVEVVGTGDRVDLAAALRLLRSLGYATILTEAGPSVNAQLLDNNLLDELFLTLSPLVAGNSGHGEVGLASGMAFLPGREVRGRLVGLRRHESYLFARYGFAAEAADG